MSEPSKEAMELARAVINSPRSMAYLVPDIARAIDAHVAAKDDQIKRLEEQVEALKAARKAWNEDVESSGEDGMWSVAEAADARCRELGIELE